MKTIFIFNDSRFTDLLSVVTALGEDGQRIKVVEFDRGLAAYSDFAMGVTHELAKDVDPEISARMGELRARVLAMYDAAYGAGNWFPMWLASPAQNIAWCRAMGLFRARAVGRGQQFSDAALGRIALDVFGGGQLPDKRTVH